MTRFVHKHRQAIRRTLVGYAAFDAYYWWKIKPRLRAAIGMEVHA